MKVTILISVAALAVAGAAPAAQSADGPTAAAVAPMERVDGIGGFFFRSKSPKALAKWYADNLGVGSTPGADGEKPWRQAEGPTAFQPFPQGTTYFERPEQMFMLNFRVKNPDAMVAQLRRGGAVVVVVVDPQTYPYGRFAATHDPDGNPIQLWEPKP
jgi:glyoxylase I family protein